MSIGRGDPDPELDTRDAINAVLEAERHAMDAIEACESTAHDLVEAARETARRIARRTDRRIAAVHARGESDAIGDRRPGASRAEPPDLTAGEIDALREAARQLAERLATAQTDDDPD